MEFKANKELEKYEGKSFHFAENFHCEVTDGIVWIEEYSEGLAPLLHIKTEKQYIELYEILTGMTWEDDGINEGYVDMN